MKNAINFQVFNNAAQYRSSNPIINAILLLIILVMIPVLIVVGIVVLITIAIIAKVKTMFSMNRAQGVNGKKPAQQHAEEFTDYVVIEEEVHK